VNHPEPSTAPDTPSRAWSRTLGDQLWHQIEVDHEVYRAIIQHGPPGDLNTRLRRMLQLDPPPDPATSAHAPSRAAAQLLLRARAAADREDLHRITDPALAHAARSAVRALADLLGVALDDITVRRDERVTHGNQPVLLLTVSDGARHHEFAVPDWQCDRILAVLPCPNCAEPVATCLIADLAAYGTLLATLPLETIAFDEPHRLLDEVADEFFTDPGHDPTCHYHPEAEGTGNQDV
jgi:hypothetical protein